MSKKFNKIMSVVLALMMVCSLLPMSAMAAENDTYTVTFAPGTLCDYTREGAYPTMTYDETTGRFLLPRPADLGLVGSYDNLVFQGWTLEGGDGTVYEVGDDVANLITGDVTFLANYVAEVIFAPGALCRFNGEGTYTLYTYDGTGEVILPDPAEVELVGRESNCVFTGWSIEGSAGDTLYPIGYNATELITGSVTFLANFRVESSPETVTYTVDPGEIRNATYNVPRTNGPIPQQYVTMISLPATDEDIESEFGWVIPSDMTFAHWENSDGTIIPVNTETNRTEDFLPQDGDVYTAIWVPVSVTTYSVTLNPGKADGNEVPGTPVVVSGLLAGSTYDGPATDPFTYEGYLIVGWSRTEDGEPVEFPITVDSNIDLYAVWEKQDVKEYWTVTFLPGEGASFRDTVIGYEDGVVKTSAVQGEEYNIAMLNANEMVEVEGGQSYNALFLTMPEGMEFAGWSDGTHTYYSGQVATVTADTTFTAVWRAEGAGPYNVILNAGSMSQYTEGEEEHYNRDYAVKVDAGGNYTLPANMNEITALGWTIPEGYEFAGWVLPSALDEPVTEVTNVRADVTVIALWRQETVHTWTITFDANGGTGEMEPVVVTTAANTYPYDLPTNHFTAPAGMEFDYWTVSGFDGEYQPEDVVNISSDVIVTAHWKPVMYYYLVTFDPGEGGSGEMAPVFIESASEIADFYVPYCTFTAPEGKTFDVWLDQNGDLYFPGDTVKIRSDLTLTAQWMDSTANFTMG